MIFVNSSSNPQNLVTLASSKGASTSSKTHIGEGLTKKTAKTNGYVSTLLGRKIHVTNITHNNFQIRSAAERTAINAPIQGTAADILKIAMINIKDWIDRENAPIKMIMQVHDELVFEVHNDFIDDASIMISDQMIKCFSLDIPLIVDIGIGDNWDKAH